MGEERAGRLAGRVATTFVEKLGPSRRTWVDWSPDKTPVFPACCPCCLERLTPGVHMRVEGREGKLRFDFPACGACVRHVAFAARITDKLGAAMFGLTVLTIAGGLVAAGGPMGLIEPFRNPIRGALTLIVYMVLLVFWGFVLRFVVIWPLEQVLGPNKPTCRWFERPVKWGAFDKPLALRRGLGFENAEYARRFCKLNGIADRLSVKGR